MSRTIRTFACYLLIGLVKGLDKYEKLCPNSYPQSCRCFPKSNWVKCENMQATTKFPRGVFNNDTKWLSIEKSSIKNITGDDFIGLHGLTRLDMTEGSLNFIQQGTFQQLLELTELKLTDNQLVSFSPGVFANLSKLGTVRLNKNPFEVLPDNMFESTPLKKLFVMYSKLNSTGIDAIGSGRVTKSITSLTLVYSNLTRLKKEQFTGLPNLKEIDLWQCNIQYIGADFLSGTKVTRLDLYNNKIIKIDQNSIRRSMIDWFTCQHCNLTTDKVFGKDRFLLPATSLTYLNLGHNEITHIPRDAFKGLTKLKYLLLFYNNISTIEENPFIVLKDFSSFGIQNNPFKCDCHLAWFHELALDKIGKTLSGGDILKKMVCASPGNITGKRFPDVQTFEFCCAAAGSSGRVCGVLESKGSTVLPTGTFAASFFLQIALFLLFFPCLLLTL